MTDEGEKTPPKAFLIPIETLHVTEPWPIGRVTIHPGTAVDGWLEQAPPVQYKDGTPSPFTTEAVNHARVGSFAEVREAPDIENAIDAVRASLDVLRLFQQSRTSAQTTTFGLSGDVYSARIHYLAVWEQSAGGFRFDGDHAGWTFNAEAFQDWLTSETFQFLSMALADPEPPNGSYRAAIGAQLLARAVMEHRPDLKILGVAAALEAWLLRRWKRSQTMKLARAVAWLGCGVQDNNLCCHARPACPYIHLSPDNDADRERLQTLRRLGRIDGSGWRCAEWHRIMDWYDERSGPVHGDPSVVVESHASEAQYWVIHYLMEPIVGWLSTHPDDPITDLETAMAPITDPTGWKAMTEALDSLKTFNSPTLPPRPPL